MDIKGKGDGGAGDLVDDAAGDLVDDGAGDLGGEGAVDLGGVGAVDLEGEGAVDLEGGVAVVGAVELEEVMTEEVAELEEVMAEGGAGTLDMVEIGHEEVVEAGCREVEAGCRDREVGVWSGVGDIAEGRTTGLGTSDARLTASEVWLLGSSSLTSSSVT